MIRSALNLTLVAILLLGASAANSGACGPFANTLYVGNTATDNECDYDTIQAAIDAVTTCPATIVITTQRTWSGQHLNITDKSLTLSGGGGNCGSVLDPGLAAPAMTTGTPPMQVSLTGYDDVDDSIIEITGNSHVTLRNLTLSGGRDVAYTQANGGGILFEGSGSLTLRNVVVMYNYAGWGGGIAMLASGGHAELHIQANTSIHNNTAQTVGGGVAVRGDARLLMVEPQSTIAYNVVRGVNANGEMTSSVGGGLAVIGAAHADIGSPGLYGPFGVTAAVAYNSALLGGGVAVYGTDARLRVFTTDGVYPATLSFNGAVVGGAVAVANGGNACFFNANLTDNVATSLSDDIPANGAAAAAHGGLYFNADPDGVCDAASLPALGAVPCPSGQVCNLVARNVSNDAGSAVPSTPVIRIVSGTLHADRIMLSDNTAGNGIRGTEADNTFFLRNCLIADNHFSYAALQMNGPSTIDHCTFANNGLDFSDTVIATDSDISLTRSIIREPTDKFALDVSSSAADVQVHHVLSSDLSTLPVSVDIITGDPHFGGSVSGNYRLQPNSPAVDFAPGSDGKDLDFRPRKVDLPFIPNTSGPGDLGAYELQIPGSTSDTLFIDGFEIVGPPT